MMLGGILAITEIKPRTNFAARYGIYSLYTVAYNSAHEARAADSRIPPANWRVGEALRPTCINQNWYRGLLHCSQPITLSLTFNDREELANGRKWGRIKGIKPFIFQAF